MFKAGGAGMTKFKSYSKYPPCLKVGLYKLHQVDP
jgi:hypothetical protein